MLYGAEIWFLPGKLSLLANRSVHEVYSDNDRNQLPTEQVCLQYARYLLGVHNKTSKLGIRGE